MPCKQFLRILLLIIILSLLAPFHQHLVVEMCLTSPSLKIKKQDCSLCFSDRSEVAQLTPRPLHFNPSLVCILLSHHSTKNSQITNDSYFISPPSNIKASFLTPSSFIPSFPSTSLTPLSYLPVSSPLVVDSQGFAPKALFSLYTKFLVSPSISHLTTGLCA